jgi:hypothetical protein
MNKFNPSDDSSVSEEDLKIRIPSSMIISGPSNSGKTEFLKRLLHSHTQLFSPAPSSILYCYGEWGSHVAELDSLPNCRTHAGMPNEDMIYALPKPALICLDDLMLESDSTFLSKLFTKMSHHNNFGIIFLTQNLFEKILRVPRVNSHTIVLMVINFIV